MKFDKRMIVNILIQAALCGLGSVGVVLAGYPQLVYVLFAGFTVANCVQHKFRDIPAMCCSELAGWVWAFAMFFLCNFVTEQTGILPLGFFCAIFFGTIAMLAFHLRLTMKTWFNMIPVMFLVIFCWFSSMDFAMLPAIIIILTVGMVLTTLYDPITNIICGYAPEADDPIDQAHA